MLSHILDNSVTISLIHGFCVGSVLILRESTTMVLEAIIDIVVTGTQPPATPAAIH